MASAKDSKDVKRPSKPSGSVLPGAVQSAAAAPQPRAGVGVSEDYFLVPSASSGGYPATGGVVRQKMVSARPGQKPLGASKVHPVLAQLGVDPAEAAELLRQELIAARSGGRHEGSLADWKHFYVVATNTAFTAAEQSFALAAIAGGTGVSSRTGATIALRRLRLNIRLERQITGASTVATRDPTYYFVLWRDKIPTTPGTAPTLHGTDTNPPSSGTLMLSQLGSAAAENVDTMVRNPITEDAYHIYAIHRLKFNTEQGYTYTGTSLGLPAPMVKHHSMEHDMNSVQLKFSSYAGSASDINNVWLTIFTDLQSSSMGYQDYFAFSTDMEFHDVQDAL